MCLSRGIYLSAFPRRKQCRQSRIPATVCKELCSAWRKQFRHFQSALIHEDKILWCIQTCNSILILELTDRLLKFVQHCNIVKYEPPLILQPYLSFLLLPQDRFRHMLTRAYASTKDYIWRRFRLSLAWMEIDLRNTKTFFKIFGRHQPFLLGRWYPYFGLLMTSAMGFKVRMDPSLVFCLACVQWILCKKLT